MSAPGHNSADARLRSFIDRVLRLKEEQDALASDIREVYAEAKGEGYDKTAMGALVAHLRKVEKQGANAINEAETIFDLYLTAYERAGSEPRTGTPVRAREIIEEFPPHDAETGELADEDQEPCDCADRAPAGEYYRCPKCDAEWPPEDEGSESASRVGSVPEAQAEPSTSTPAGSASDEIPSSNSDDKPFEPVTFLTRKAKPVTSHSDPYDPGPIPSFMDRRASKAGAA